MKSRYVPILEFVLDEGVRNSMEVARLLGEEKARAESAVASPESTVEDAETGDADEKLRTED
jgi:ribosome-binding factor A